MKKPWVDTDPNVIAIKEYSIKALKFVAVASVVYVMAYGAGKAIGTHAVNQK